jgi:ubiquinone/menaquinone biosynthesis C-methylase UbiE
MRLHGADLSPAYIKLARKRLLDLEEVSLAVENGEALPWADETFDVVTSTYMFHELPRNARRNVVRESGGADKVRLLDVGCGTGRTLHQLAIAHPTMRLHGADLSPAYIKLARKRLEHVAELTLAVENGEALPWADETFDVVTSTYMFHELPRNARRNVVREMLRVVRPGGLVVIEDSAQLSESAELESVLRGFPREFHEPFYADYLEDDLGALLEEVGFGQVGTEPHLVAKVVIGTKP